MNITVHVNGYYDWVPVPADTKVTPEDIRAKRVKPASGPSANGTIPYLMRVSRKGVTHTSITLPEHQIAEMIIQEMIKEKTALTRHEAVGHYLARHVMPHNAHKSWMTGFEVHDDGPNEELFRKKIAEHVDAGNIEDLDVEELVQQYLSNADGGSDSHVDHLHKHFGVKKGAVQ